MNNQEEVKIDSSSAKNTEKAVKTAQQILTCEDKDLRSFLNKDIVMNALSCQNLDILDLKMIDRVMAEFQHAARIFKPYRSIRKVSIFGSARVAENNPYYELASEIRPCYGGEKVYGNHRRGRWHNAGWH